MDCKYQLKDGCMRISMPKEVDHHCAEQLRKEADLLIGAYHIRKLVFDFSETEFMDSSGIGIIIGRYKKISYFGGKVFAINTDARIKRTLMICGLHKVIEIME